MTNKHVESLGPLCKDSIGYTIISLVGTHRALTSQLIRKLGLYPGQEMMLMALRNEDCQSQNSLTKSLCVDHSTIAKSVSRLENAGLITKTRSKHDRRITNISLTDAGQKISQEISAIWNDVEGIASDGLSDTERQQFIVLSQKIVTNLQNKIE